MKSMRDFINEGVEKGLCKKITAEVDWNLGAVAYRQA